MKTDVIVWHDGDEMPPENTVAVVDIREPSNYMFDDYEHLGILYHHTDWAYSCIGFVQDGEWHFTVLMPEGDFQETTLNLDFSQIVRWAAVPFVVSTAPHREIIEGERAKELADQLKDVPFTEEYIKVSNFPPHNVVLNLENSIFLAIKKHKTSWVWYN